MPERRKLIEGLSTAQTQSSEAEREFVYAGKATPDPGKEETVEKPQGKRKLSKAPLTTRIRDDYAKALKRASLERQLAGVEPNTLQDILEEAVGPWLKENGYSPD